MGILPMPNQLWVDDPRPVNFWVKNQFSLKSLSKHMGAQLGAWYRQETF
jgi:hypothetical protein